MFKFLELWIIRNQIHSLLMGDPLRFSSSYFHVPVMMEVLLSGRPGMVIGLKASSKQGRDIHQ